MATPLSTSEEQSTPLIEDTVQQLEALPKAQHDLRQRQRERESRQRKVMEKWFREEEREKKREATYKKLKEKQRMEREIQLKQHGRQKERKREELRKQKEADIKLNSPTILEQQSRPPPNHTVLAHNQGRTLNALHLYEPGSSRLPVSFPAQHDPRIGGPRSQLAARRGQSSVAPQGQPRAVGRDHPYRTPQAQRARALNQPPTPRTAEQPPPPAPEPRVAAPVHRRAKQHCRVVRRVAIANPNELDLDPSPSKVTSSFLKTCVA